MNVNIQNGTPRNNYKLFMTITFSGDNETRMDNDTDTYKSDTHYQKTLHQKIDKTIKCTAIQPHDRSTQCRLRTKHMFGNHESTMSVYERD